MQKTLVLLLILLWGARANTQTLKQIVDSAVKSEKKNFPDVGIVIGIYQNYQTDYYTYGTRTKKGQKKLDSLTLFEIGSATKTFTSLLLAEEINKGNIHIHDFIDKFMPKNVKLNNDIKGRVRVTDLVSHQSGLPNLSNDQYFKHLIEKDPTNPFRFVSNEFLIKTLTATDTLSGYGKYQYNNYSYALLGLLFEEYLNTPYEELIKKVIISPLNLNNTGFSRPDHNSNVAGLYNQQGMPQKPIILNRLNPAGGLVSNASDLITYLVAHLNKNVLSEAIAITQKSFYKDTDRNIGLGWEIGNGYYQKDGDTFGNSCLLRYSPAHKTAIVVLSNHQNGQLVRNIMNAVFERIMD